MKNRANMRLILGLMTFWFFGCSMDEQSLEWDGGLSNESSSAIDGSLNRGMPGADSGGMVLGHDSAPEPIQDGGLNQVNDGTIDVDCRAECGERAARFGSDCHASGGSDSECEQQRRVAMRSCVQDVCGGMMRGGNMEGTEAECRTSCREQAEALASECTNAGGSDADCERQHRINVRSCVRRDCGRMGDGNVGGADDDCRDDCRGQADRLVEDCRASGGTAEDCIQRGRGALRTCVRDECRNRSGVDVDDPEACAEACVERSERIEAVCLSNGGSEVSCAQRRRRARRNCSNNCN
ncbi:MAG: hypothetical protein VYA30_02020 [Myxococcota bacterium]|nr:hypothetical protein [Myxococcota bacterium]